MSHYRAAVHARAGANVDDINTKALCVAAFEVHTQGLGPEPLTRAHGAHRIAKQGLRAEPVALGARAIWGVKGEEPRLHLGEWGAILWTYKFGREGLHGA